MHDTLDLVEANELLWPLDMLKIDATLVRELGTHAGDLAIGRAIIGLAEAFDLQLVAEGVETTAAAVTLMRHGCYRAQGFLTFVAPRGRRYSATAIRAPANNVFL
jgi:EAL domain-containing protein (putative c-di-GMP-specific phosphodiesterase class I)